MAKLFLCFKKVSVIYIEIQFIFNIRRVNVDWC